METLEAPKASFLIKRFEVTVTGYGSGIYDAASRGQALADAWRCDAFGHIKFGAFMKMANCRRVDAERPFGDAITVEGRPAFYGDGNRAYVRFAYPDGNTVLNAHPLEVLPEQYRPEGYRSPALRAHLLAQKDHTPS